MSSLAHVWDGVGPRGECLLLVMYPSGNFEWMHFDWRDADAEPDGEGGWNGNPDEYWHEQCGISIRKSSDGWMGTSGFFDDVQGDDFKVTHWAELPQLPEGAQP